MFRRTQAVAVAAISRSEAHGHATMNDAQTLMKGIGEIVKAAAEDLTEVADEVKKTLKETRDGVTIETKVKVDWEAVMLIAGQLKAGIMPTVSELPLSLVNKIILEEKEDQK